jgi:hypothetical protein
MKKAGLTLILFCCCLAGFADKPVEVVVLMKARYDRTQLERQAAYLPFQEQQHRCGPGRCLGCRECGARMGCCG